MALGRQTSTPPTALVIAAKPSKLTTMVWSTRRPVRASTVFWVQAGLPCSLLPTENALLNITLVCGLVQFLFGSMHLGMLTSASRGNETPTACLWSA